MGSMPLHHAASRDTRDGDVGGTEKLAATAASSTAVLNLATSLELLMGCALLTMGRSTSRRMFAAKRTRTHEPKTASRVMMKMTP